MTQEHVLAGEMQIDDCSTDEATRGSKICRDKEGEKESWKLFGVFETWYLTSLLHATQYYH